MNCTICGKQIVLIPSAKERARKFGGCPEDYTKLFKEHTDCFLKKRAADTTALIQRISKEG